VITGKTPRKRIIDALFSESLIALIAVFVFSMSVSAIFIVLSWITYRDRYGISLMDFLGFTF